MGRRKVSGRPYRIGGYQTAEAPTLGGGPHFRREDPSVEHLAVAEQLP